MKEEMKVELDKALEEPVVIRGIEVYINVYTEYDVEEDEDLETGATVSFKETGVDWDINLILDPKYDIELDDINLTEEDIRYIQEYAEMNSGHSDDEIMEEYRRNYGI